MLTLLMLSVVAIDVISTLLLLCRKLLGRGHGARLYAARLTHKEAEAQTTPPPHTD